MPDRRSRNIRGHKKQKDLEIVKVMVGRMGQKQAAEWKERKRGVKRH